MAAFTPPLILNAPRPLGSRLRDALLTVLLWFWWFYLLLAAIGALWVPPFVHHLLPVNPPDHPWDVLRVAAIFVGIALACCTFLLVRVMLERRRFAGEDRRRPFPPPDIATLAGEFGVPEADLSTWRAAKRVVVHHDDEGHITKAETTT